MERMERRFSRWRKDLEEEFQSPEKLYKNACDLMTKYAYPVGIERFDPSYSRSNIRFSLLLIDFAFFVTFGIWSIVKGWGNLISVTFSFVTFSIGVQCGIKGIVFSSSAIAKLQQYNLERFENPAKFPEVRNILMKTAFHNKAAVEILKRFYAMIGIFTVLFSIAMSVADREFELPYGFYVPEADRNSWTGYLINLGFQTLQMCLSVGLILSSDLMLFNFIINAMSQIEIILVYLNKISSMCDQNEAVDCHELLKELIEKHVEHTRYMTTLDDLMKAGFFFNFGCLIAEAVSCLYVLTTVDEVWYPGFLFIWCSIYQLGIVCYLGSLLTSKNDKLIREIYITSWTKLPILEQKMLQLMLFNAQTSVILTDGFTPISLETFMQIIKNIYSYFTVLQSFN